MTRERAKEIQRLDELLEDAGIKLSSVATDISGVFGRAMVGSAGRRRTEPSRAGRAGQAQVALEDPGADRGVDRPVW